MPALATFADGLGKSLGPAFNSVGKVIREDVLPIIKAWYGFLADTIVPGIMAVVRPVFEGLVGAFNKIKNAVSDNSEELKPFLGLLKSVAEFARDVLAPILGGAFKLALETIGTIVAGLVTGFSRLVGFITQTITKIKEFVKFVTDNPVTRFFFGGGGATGASFATGSGSQGLVFGGEDGSGGGIGGGSAPVIVTSKQGGTRDISGLSLAQQAAVLRSVELQAETARLREAREAAAAARTAATGGLSTSERIVINVNAASIIDEEGFTRAATSALNNSTYRGTNGASNLVFAQ
jgi:Flp pilus assembly pilin Flp